jgi:ATP-dependent DNA helicase HFM1/MER3
LQPKAAVEVAIAKKLGAQIKHGLELYVPYPPSDIPANMIPRIRCLSAKAWEDRPTVLRQVEQIGEKSYE